MSTRQNLSFVLVAAAAVACGPGREAAWEKESAQTQTAPAADPNAATGATDELAKAEELWTKRDSRAELEQAIAIWEKDVAATGGSGKTLTRLSRAYYLLGDGFMRLAGETDASLATLEKGTLVGEQAMMAISPAFAEKVKAGAKVEEAVQLIGAEGQETIYWYAANLGKFANLKGFTTRLFYKDRLFAVNTHVLNLGETFFHGAPHRFFGGFYAVAPAFAGGDLNKSKEHFEKALALDANYFGTKVLYAEFYATKAEDKALFQKLLGEVQAGDPAVLPEVVPEQKMEQTKAKMLLEQIDELF